MRVQELLDPNLKDSAVYQTGYHLYLQKRHIVKEKPFYEIYED